MVYKLHRTNIKLKKNQLDSIRAYAVLLPFYIWFSIFITFPLLFILGLSLFEWNGIGTINWAGLKNFVAFFKNPAYIKALGRQIGIGGLCLLVNSIVSFGVSLLLNLPSKMRGFFRSSVYVPALSAIPATTAVFVALLNPYGGGINAFLQSINMDTITWTYSTFWMTFWIVFYFVWRNIGPAAIMWLGGIQSIPTYLYEAARIDGANFWQEIRYVTLPGLSFVAKFIIITGIIAVMQMFPEVMFISGGGPIGTTEVLALKIYKDGILGFNFGMAGAGTTILVLLSGIFTLIYIRLSKEGEA